MRFLLAVATLCLAAGCRRAPQAAGAGSASAPSTLGGVGFAGPAAVLHDPDRDRYYVSNTNGPAGLADDNGFISKLSPSGEIIALKWIDGASKDVSLSAPWGMAVAGSYLYVTDVTTIRRFNTRSGAPEGEVPVPGAVFLNALHSAADGAIFFTDGGDSSAAGAVYRLSQEGKLDTLARGSELGHPTGIAVTGDSVWVVNQEGEMYRIAGGRRLDVMALPTGGLEGLVLFGGDAFVSSGAGRSVLRGRIGGPFTPLLTGVEAPADLGHDLWRNRILVPLFRTNELRIVRLAF